MENRSYLITKLEKYSAYYLSKYIVTKNKFKNILSRKINNDYYKKKLSLEDKIELESLIDDVTNKFIKLNVINEERMIKNRIDSLVSKGFSLKKIYFKLISDKFDKNLISNEMQKLNKINDLELNLIRNYCEKKIKNFKKTLECNDKKNFERILNKLLSQGFRKETCFKFFRIIKKDILEWNYY